MNKKLVAGIFIIVLILSACQIKKDTTAFIPIGPSLTPSSVSATNTRRPTKTATAIPPTATADIQATQTRQADDLLQAEMDAFPTSCENAQKQVLSPDHSTLAISCGYNSDQTLEIISKSEKKWDLKFINYLSKELIASFDKIYEGDRFLEGGLVPLEWSKDGKYLYFASTLQFDVDGPCFFGFGILGLYRINVETGKIATILYPSNSLYDGYKYAFSPDGRWLAYGKNRPYLLDLITWNNLPLDDIGNTYNFTWSPDSSELAFVFDYSKMIVFKTESNVSNILVNEEGMCLYITPFTNKVSIEVINGDEWVVLDRYYIYDWTSGEINQITSTPME